MEQGTQVEVWWSDEEVFYPGTVTSTRDNCRKLYVKYEDGDEEWIDTRYHKIRIQSTSTRTKTASSTTKSNKDEISADNNPITVIEIGCRLEIWSPKEKTYYCGRVTKRKKNSSSQYYFVEYEDGEKKEWVDLGRHDYRILETKNKKAKANVQSASLRSMERSDETLNEDPGSKNISRIKSEVADVDSSTSYNYSTESDESFCCTENEKSGRSRKDKKTSTRSSDEPSSNLPTTQKRKRRTWEEGFEDLKKFHSEHGHCQAKASTLVGRWSAEQRKNKEKLTSEQIESLNNLDFDWEDYRVKLDRQWNEMFDCLKKYKQKFGHTRVPQKKVYEGKSLGNWVTNQHSHFRTQTIQKERKDKLNAIGFEWTRDERLQWKCDRPLGKVDDWWNSKFDALCEYKKLHGDTLVPAGHMSYSQEHGEHFDLGAWVTVQRNHYRQNWLRNDRLEKLDSIDFVFKIDFYNAEASNNQKKWDEMFEKLVEYKEKHGDCDVPSIPDEVELKELAAWVRIQRKLFKEQTIAENRLQRLNDLDFNWKPLEERWNEMVRHLQAYKKEFGDCLVPKSYVTPCKSDLGSWVQTVRATRRGSRGDFVELSFDRIKQLDELGFVWENVFHLKWDIMFNELKKYKNKYGDTRVPQSFEGETDGLPARLGNWVSDQRFSLKQKLEQTRNPIYVERIKRLDSLGFDWSLAEQVHINWDKMFSELKKYKERYGDCRVPYLYTCDCDGLPRELGVWVSEQKGRIPGKAQDGHPVYVERKRRLDELGFSWQNGIEEKWEIMFTQLKYFKEQHGHCRVPRGYDGNCERLPAKFGSWCSIQARDIPLKVQEGHPLYLERKRRLDEIGFDWNCMESVFRHQWDDMFTRLKTFYEENGHCRVSKTYDDGVEGPSLAAWVRRQIIEIPMKIGDGDPKYLERKKQLESINFEFKKVYDSRWQTMFEVLKRYKEKHGHCRVPLRVDDDTLGSPMDFGRWCHDQRRSIPPKINSGDATYQQRKQLLDSVGFAWELESEKEARWNAMFEGLLKYKQEFGHCLVPTTYVSDASLPARLAEWVGHQQDKLPDLAAKGDPIYTSRKERLDAIGFEWNRKFEKKWDEMLNQLKSYKKQNGNFRVPYRKNGQNDSLGVWVYAQRTKIPPRYKEGDPIAKERKQRLDAIGFEWKDASSGQWDAMYEGLKHFKMKTGNTRVPRNYVDANFPLPVSLGSWISTQRQVIPARVEEGDPKFIRRKRLLDELEFKWKTRASRKEKRTDEITKNTGVAAIKQTKKRKCRSGKEADDRTKNRNSSKKAKKAIP